MTAFSQIQIDPIACSLTLNKMKSVVLKTRHIITYSQIRHTEMLLNMYINMNKCRIFFEYGCLQIDPELSLFQLLLTRGSIHSKSISNSSGGSFLFR